MTDVALGMLAFVFMASPILFGVWIFILRRRLKALNEQAGKYLRVAKGWKSKHDTQKQENERLNERFSDIADRDQEVARLTSEIAKLDSEYAGKREAEESQMSLLLAQLRREHEAEERRLSGLIDSLNDEYSRKRLIYDQISHDVHELQEAYSFMEIGIYEPHFDYGDSASFQKEIKRVQDEKKAMVKAGSAIEVEREFTVGGSKKEGDKMLKRQTALTLRAFNGEASSAISNTRWNNVLTMEKRIERAVAAIDKANTSMGLTINPRYVKLNIKELRLTHEYREKQKQEREERAELARAEREEAKLQQEADRAEREEQRYQALLDKAREEALKGDQSEKLKQRIALLQEDLEAARSEKERSRAMAEMTRCGYVYVISNIGSFGEDIVKIGLTRRLDPEDRVKELSGASVPFSFDVHAMIYSENAPTLEADLHREFHDSRVNIANNRKEFFRCTIDQVQDALNRLAPEAQFYPDPEAREYRETMQMRAAKLSQLNGTGQPASSEKYPAVLH